MKFGFFAETWRFKIAEIAPITIPMRPTEPLKRKSLQAPGYYALALRAIGQDLARLFPCDWEIVTQPDGFSVRGHCPKACIDSGAADCAKPAVKSLLGQLWRRPAPSVRPDPAAEVVEFNRIYGSQEIDRLDQLGANYRSAMNRIPDPRSLGESLRTIGRMIDANHCQLTLLKKFPDRLVVDYRDNDNQRQTEELTKVELDKLQRRYYDDRGKFNLIDMLPERQD